MTEKYDRCTHCSALIPPHDREYLLEHHGLQAYTSECYVCIVLGGFGDWSI